MTPELLSELRAIVGAEGCLSKPDELLVYECDGLTLHSRLPEAVVLPRSRQEVQAVADTLVLEPDDGRFMITWRASLPLKKNMFEVPQVLAGKMSRAWWRARELGKTYYKSLDELSRHKRAQVEGVAE